MKENKQRQADWRARQRAQGRSRVEFWVTPGERRALVVLLNQLRDKSLEKRWGEST